MCVTFWTRWSESPSTRVSLIETVPSPGPPAAASQSQRQQRQRRQPDGSGVLLDRGEPVRLHIQVPRLEGVFFDELAAGFHFVAHEDSEHVVGGAGVVHGDL